ncbi:amidohydrolase family protein [Mucilaginibacter glaciei]|uniref:Amidohydrolase family protein n=1 Tax=Mucilaginibacter glaciei TaxID=2772109 RepID=A0A926S0C4_9SPHI|nr:amidohydrolase family protein [Mucilaginibacter glaciei]MBD1392800.1 amidohydrolase family protein [Mucilaginibacter glaciei]
MLKIDSHQHFWLYHPVKDAWITDDLKAIQQDFLPADLSPILEQHGIGGCIAVQADQSEKETEFLVELARQHSFIKGVVGWVDLQSEDIEEQLARYNRQPIIKGFRHILQGEPDDRFMLGDQFQRGISLLHKYNFTYDILIKPQHLPYATELAGTFPQQRFVVDHMAKPLIKDQILDNWEQGIKDLAVHPNVYCKVSGLVTEADWHRHQPEDFKPYLNVVFEAFGIERLMFGSDWPVCNVAGGYDAAINTIRGYIGQFDKAGQEKFWAGNATAFYRL